jgi:hypothetical protein
VTRSLRVFAVAVALLFALALFWLLFYFGMLNTRWVVLRVPLVQWVLSDPFPAIEYEAPLWVIMLLSFLSGLVLALLLGVLPAWIKRGVERGRDRRFIHNLEGELTDLRNLPINNPAPLEDVTEDLLPPADAGSARAPTEQDLDLLVERLQDASPRRGER